ncbi:DUF481 domain-containing protein [Shewanella sp. NKUCC05_KAH]|uniref:DUF481 domain-containing protein n=1 Tax=Shewanella TaxID=22 RepID=UPI001C5BCD05|nr:MULTISPECIES: DUF481 domain-containing protein [unclassified Shewanella]MBW3515110.1 DUF481 domain-containing protein [Shewanella sp. NKUCC01_JLK]MBW3527472.1 DUF481 domain-containing protein [Shewanella sp. NKUCC05_KAH]
MKKVLTAALLMAAPFMATAGADFVKGDETFAGEAELGATLTTGNTETSSFKGRLNLKHELGDWENQYLLEGLYKEDTGSVTAKRYLAGAQGNYKMTDRSYLFANGNYEVDPFTGYDYTLSGAAGYGYRFYDTSKTFLDVEVGPGYIYQRLDTEQALIEGHDTNDSVVAHGVINFETEITDTSKFQQRFVADYGDKLDARSETSLTANIIGALAMKFAIIVRYNSEPLDNKKSTDTETNMTLLYSF